MPKTQRSLIFDDDQCADEHAKNADAQHGSAPAAARPPDLPPSIAPDRDSPAIGEQPRAGEQPPGESAVARPSAPLDRSELKDALVYVVDAHSLIFQVFHVMADWTGPAGQPVGAVFGFTRDVLEIIEKRKPDFLFCAFDSHGPTFRHEAYADYKVDREEMPEDLRPQLPLIKEILAALAVPVLELAGFEADDILATMAEQVDRAGGRCVLVTGDKDCRQLISDRVTVLNIRKNEFFDAEALKKTWGIRPDQVVDFQALVGDKVDHVPGVDLIGPKIAAELLQQYETLDAVLDNAESVSGKKRKQNLIEQRDRALMSRELVRLDRQVPIDIDYAAGRVGGIDRDAAINLFQQLDFHQFQDQVRGPVFRKLSLKAGAVTRWETNYQAVVTTDQLEQLVEKLRAAKSFAVDTETTHANPRWADLVGISFATAPGEAFYVPVKAPTGATHLDEPTVIDALKPLLEESGIEKVGQNLKYDINAFRNLGVTLAGPMFDTMIADYLLEAGARDHSLDELSNRYLDHKTIPIKDLIGTGKSQKQMDEVPLELISGYACEDADVPWRLRELLQQRLHESGLTELFETVEMPLSAVLAEVEYEGVSIDVDRLAQLSKQFGLRMEAVEQEIHQIAGREFNIGSPKQLAEVLFDELQLPVQKKTKTGRSTDADVLDELAQIHELPAKIVEYRQYAKLKGTYLDALPELVCPRTNRVHTSLNQVVAATGRLSSNDPNLQNIPVRTQEGREIRSAFTAGREGWSLLLADYSQIELRMLAHFSRDENLRDAFANDEDIHTRVAAEIHGVPPEQVDRDLRRSAKAINFGIIYGQTSFGLAKSLGIDKEVAAAFIESYFARYPRVEELMEQILVECRTNGHVTTILGRRRDIQGVRDANKRARNPRFKTLPERTAINSVIQGSAADLIKLAMLRIHRRLRDDQYQSRLLLQIHDELVFEAPQDELDRLGEMVRQEMITAHELSVPLKVDVKAGQNWAECDPVG